MIGKGKKRIVISLTTKTCDVLDTLSAGGVSKSQLIESAIHIYAHELIKANEAKKAREKEENALQEAK